MEPIEFEKVDEKLYQLNSVVSLSIALEKDLKKQKKYQKINKMIGEVIKECREK